ncbi:GPI inositol-deacylase isoform X2 [Pseudophryne corroboree]|uniref:GPI inositol-deacylase isoform X2 n=1 Tax=Pseudophryne corroboree TaxID=495146 RepID=UPI003081FAAE
MKLVSAIFNGFLVLLVAIGIRDVFFVYEMNSCSMTYMFEYPEYQKIKLPQRVSRLFPAYELYLYGEGIYAEKNKNLSLSGIPVLFLPGNAGSYKQVRSFGSIALRKAENINYSYHFNVFSVNFNEELVALYGGSLHKQTKFVHTCIKAILRLYKNQEFPPQSVVILGHSMAGLVARALLTLKNFKPQLINLIITQATPHIMPVLPVDYYLTDFYALVNSYWILNANKLQNITTLSVAGGFRDFQVRSGLTFLPASNIHNSVLSVVSTAVPRTWAATDHLSIVWCRELNLATARALFDLIDENTRQITEDPIKRMSILQHHFVKHAAKLYESSYETVINISESASLNYVKTTKWGHTVINACNETYFAFPLQDKRKTYTHFHCRNTFLYTHSWIFGCADKVSAKCVQIEDFSWRTDLLSTAKIVTLNMEEFSNFSHFVLYLPTTNNSKFSVECEFLNEDLNTMQLPVTHALSFGFSSSHIKINSSGLLHILQLQGFNKIYQAFNILIKKNCTESIESKPNIFRLHVPWSHEDIIRISSDELPLQLSAKLHVPQPQNDSRMVMLTLYTSADCYYEIVRCHWPSLQVYILSNLLLAYGAQLHYLSSTGHCLEFDASLDVAAKPYKVDPIINICRFLLGYDWFKHIWDTLFLPPLDSSELHSLGLLFPVASLLLFMFGTGIAYWSGMIFKLTIKILSRLWIALTRSTDLPKEDAQFTFKLFAEIFFFFFVSWTTCGAFGTLLVFLRYLIKVVKLQSVLKRYPTSECGVQSTSDSKATNILTSNSSSKTTEVDNAIPASEQETAIKPNSNSDSNTAADSLKMHITIMNLLLWMILLILPSFIYWLKNIRYNFQLDPDPMKFLAIILVFTMEMLMNFSILSIKASKLLKTTARLQLPFSVIVVAFGQLHLYRAAYFITFSLFVHALSNFI